MSVFVVLDAGEVIDRVYADYEAALARAAEIDGVVLACEVIGNVE